MRCSVLSLFAASCLLASGVSAQTTTVLLVGGAATATAGADGVILTFLQNRYAAANVTYVTATGLTSQTILGYDVVVLSATAQSLEYRGKVDLSRAPIVNLEEAMAADNQPGQFAVTNRMKVNLMDPKIVINIAHPITAGLALSTPLPLFTGTDWMWWSTALYPPGTTVLAAQDGTPGNGFMSFVDAGGTLLNGTMAPCRRVMFGMDNNTFAKLSVEGLVLFGQAVDWAAGACCAQSNNYGTGLTGTTSIPTISLDAPPVFLQSVNVQVTSSIPAGTSGAIIVGGTATNLPLLGGTVLASPAVVIGIAVPSTGGSLALSIPDFSYACGGNRAGLRLYMQAIEIDAGAVRGLSFSPGLRLQLGN